MKTQSAVAFAFLGFALGLGAARLFGELRHVVVAMVAERDVDDVAEAACGCPTASEAQ
jgi:hypothetical protein